VALPEILDGKLVVFIFYLLDLLPEELVELCYLEQPFLLGAVFEVYEFEHQFDIFLQLTNLPVVIWMIL